MRKPFTRSVRERENLQRPKPGAGAALDGRGDQRLEVEAVTQQFDDAQLFLTGFAVRGDEIAGDRISGLAQLCRKGAFDRLQCFVEAVLSGDQIGAVTEHPR